LSQLSELGVILRACGPVDEVGLATILDTCPDIKVTGPDEGPFGSVTLVVLFELVDTTDTEPMSAELGTTAAQGMMTMRELEILRLLSEGLNTREIGYRIRFSERTVKSALHSLMTRLRLRNRTHAVAFAIRNGYV
jgi:DNA-binding CsgD family transcriptional regulator